MDNFIKRLIIINGLIIPAVVLIGLVVFVINLFPKNYDHNDSDSKGLIVNNRIVDQKGDTMIFQGVNVTSPSPIFDSTYYYMEVSPKVYEVPEIRRNNEKKEVMSCRIAINDFDKSNILVLDKNFNCIGKLTDQKAAITRLLVPWENIKHMNFKPMAYLAAFKDNNKDGVISCEDNRDLYITYLPDFKTVKVTSRIDVEDFKFINGNTELFISYFTRENMRQEYKIEKYAIYSLTTGNLKQLESIDQALNEVIKIQNKRK